MEVKSNVEKETNYKIIKTNKICRILYSFFCNKKEISKKIKTKIYEKILVPNSICLRIVDSNIKIEKQNASMLHENTKEKSKKESRDQT